MARKLSYPFNTLEKVGDSIDALPCVIKYGRAKGQDDNIFDAERRAGRYARRYFNGDKVRVTRKGAGFRFERVAG